MNLSSMCKLERRVLGEVQTSSYISSPEVILAQVLLQKYQKDLERQRGKENQERVAACYWKGFPGSTPDADCGTLFENQQKRIFCPASNAEAVAGSNRMGLRNRAEALNAALSIEIVTLGNVRLKHPRQMFLYGRVGEPLPPSLSEDSRAFVSLSPSHYWIEGTIAYTVENSDLCLVLTFFVNEFQNCYVALALAPREWQLNRRNHLWMWQSSADIKFREDKARCDMNGNPQTLVVNCGCFFALMKFSRDSGPTITVDVGSNKPKDSPVKNKIQLFESLTKSLERVSPSKNEEGSGGNWREELSKITDDFGCVIEIENGLQVPLECPLLLPMQGKARKLCQALPPKGKLAAVTASHERNVEGILSYRIKGQNIRFAILFRNIRGRNEFSMGFTPMSFLTKRQLLAILHPSVNEWRTRPDRRRGIQAKDGEQSIQYGNVQVCASISEENKSVIKIKMFNKPF